MSDSGLRGEKSQRKMQVDMIYHRYILYDNYEHIFVHTLYIYTILRMTYDIGCHRRYLPGRKTKLCTIMGCRFMMLSKSFARPPW